MRRFVGIDLGREPVPDETRVCRFRHLLKHGGTLEKAAAMGEPWLDQRDAALRSPARRAHPRWSSGS
jgi:IS5 family transposase